MMSYALMQPLALSVTEDCELRLLEYSSVDFCKQSIEVRMQSKKVVKEVR